MAKRVPQPSGMSLANMTDLLELRLLREGETWYALSPAGSRGDSPAYICVSIGIVASLRWPIAVAGTAPGGPPRRPSVDHVR